MSSREYIELKAQLDRIESLLSGQALKPAGDDLLLLSKAAKVCGVEKRWLLERVQDKDIPAYRHSDNAPWRVYASDVMEHLKLLSNKKQVRQPSVLKMLRVA